MNPKTRNIESFKKLLKESFPGEEYADFRNQVIGMIKAAANGEEKKANLTADFSQLVDLIDVIYSNPTLEEKKPGMKEKIKHHKMKYRYWDEWQKISNPQKGDAKAIKEKLAEEFNYELSTVEKWIYPTPEPFK